MMISFETLREGDGKHFAHLGDVVTVHYTTRLKDGRTFDTSKTRGRQPFCFVVGNGTVVEAWDHVLPKMTLGQRVLVISSSDNAYGSRGIPPIIPGGETIKFEIELLSIHK